MRDFLTSRLQKNRAPPLVHSWEFWHDRQDRAATAQAEENSNGSDSGQAVQGDARKYEERLVKLTEINDVRSFWAVFNNFDIERLPLRDSIHLFHKGIKPIWEDPRNVRGGSWTFRVPKSVALQFWQDLCMMAIGEQLQAAVDSPRTTFRDDICGVSLGVRFNSLLIQVWNRDGDHKEGIDRLLATILENLSPALMPGESTRYYKKHSDHAGFAAVDTPK